MSLTIRPMRQEDVADADRVFRLAFGTFFGLADPASFRGDGALIHPRFAAAPEGAFVAEQDGRILGSIMASDWGRVGLLGPLTVHPEYWSQGVARALMPAAMALFDKRGVTLAGLFTHPQSPKHIRLYESFGFELQYNTAILAKAIAASEAPSPPPAAIVLLSSLGAADQAMAMEACRAITESIYPGLDLGREIAAGIDQRLGDVVLLMQDKDMAGFAVCHAGPGSEGGNAMLYVKFAAAPPGGDAPENLGRLLEGCEWLAAQRHAPQIVAGVNTARRGAYALLKARGYRIDRVGVAMHRPDSAGYNRPESFVLDDFR